MKALFFLLVGISTKFALGSKNVIYPMQIIEYLLDVHVGIFESVFLDVSGRSPYENVLGDLLRAPQLQYTVKYVIQGPFQSGLLPKNPSLLVIHPWLGADFESMEQVKNFFYFLHLFHPATKVLVFMDFSEQLVESVIRFALVKAKFNNVLFLDTTSETIRLSSLTKRNEIKRVFPHPRNLFTWCKDQLQGHIIKFAPEPTIDFKTPASKWIMVTAEYLKGEARLFIKRRGDQEQADVRLAQKVAKYDLRPFRAFFVTTPEIGRILVPRGRPLSIVELMALPFNWEVWTLLLVVLSLAEMARHFFPDVFKNDPVMLVVCGFERYNMHLAGRWEKMFLHSLMILMFLMTSAFETKFISFLVDKPSVQTVRKLTDFDKYGLKFRSDLTKHPEHVNNSVIGKYIINSTEIAPIWQDNQQYARFVDQNFAESISRISYDFERGQSWFVPLKDEIFLHGILIHETAFRSQYLETFRYTHVALDEAGILSLWMHQYTEFYIKQIWGSRPLGIARDVKYLVFDDLLVAWVALAVGYGLSMVGFLGEITEMRISKWSIFGRQLRRSRGS